MTPAWFISVPTELFKRFAVGRPQLVKIWIFHPRQTITIRRLP